MRVDRLQLTNYRCYRDLDVQLPAGRVVLVGDNAQGKSSLLEALIVAATVRSAHGAPDRELVRWDAGRDDGLAFGRVAAHVQAADGAHDVEVIFLVDEPHDASGRAEDEPAAADRRVSKRVRIDGSARRALDAVGVLRAVLFAPQHLALVDGPPAARRRYLDVLLCQLDATYCRALSRYNKVLANRNHLLRQLRSRSGADELEYWDDALAECGGIILARRAAAVTDLAREVLVIHDELSGAGGALDVGYMGTVAQVEEGASWRDALKEALVGARRREIARGITLAGPHRDDLSFLVDGVDLRSFGSRGQQRTAALALKLAEAELLRSPTGDGPVVLLDDVMSELDAGRRDYLAQRLAVDAQVLLTATDLEHVPTVFRRGATTIGIRAAHLVPLALEGAA